jgi:hypothetical protein
MISFLFCFRCGGVTTEVLGDDKVGSIDTLVGSGVNTRVVGFISHVQHMGDRCGLTYYVN